MRGVTALTRVRAASPLKVLNPRNAGPSAWVYLATYGGGLLGGDALSVDVSVGAGAHALVADTSVNKSVPIGARRVAAIARARR